MDKIGKTKKRGGGGEERKEGRRKSMDREGKTNEGSQKKEGKG